jgi:hypothetical protein
MGGVVTEVDWGDGLSWEEVLELAYRINIDSILKPDLHARLQRGVNAGMKIAPALQNAVTTMPWLTGMLHVDIDAEDIASATDVLQLVKRLLDT